MKRFAILIIGIIALGIAGYTGWMWFDAQRTVVVVISDDSPRSLPSQIELVRGIRDTLIIRNDTDIPALIAGRNIAPGQQIRQRFLSAGEYTFTCSTHSGADFAVIVRDP